MVLVASVGESVDRRRGERLAGALTADARISGIAATAGGVAGGVGVGAAKLGGRVMAGFGRDGIPIGLPAAAGIDGNAG
jgi:hypothetical protein